MVTRGAQRLAAKRARAGLSQAAVARLLGVGQQMVAKYEAGKRVPATWSVIEAARKHFGIRPSEWSKPAEPRSNA